MSINTENIIGLGLELSKKYLLPLIKKIGTSLISNLAKTTYKRFYAHFIKMTESFEKALDKLGDTSDIKKFKTRVECCRLGLDFFTKIKKVLDSVLDKYTKAVENAENKLEELC